jgi:hypothetical protein
MEILQQVYDQVVAASTEKEERNLRKARLNILLTMLG